MPAYKRPYDIALIILCGVVLIPLWLPLCLLAALAIWLSDRGPVLYTQERLGKDGRRFRIIKFRTMVRDAESETGPVWAERNDPRITRIGKLLRPTQIDELPQLINILRGEMSLVGPRPERPELTERFERDVPGYKERMRALPGMAGLAQVRGNYWTPPRQQLRYDNLYIKRMGPGLDTQIIFMAVVLVLRRCLLPGTAPARKKARKRSSAATD